MNNNKRKYDNSNIINESYSINYKNNDTYNYNNKNVINRVFSNKIILNHIFDLMHNLQPKRLATIEIKVDEYTGKSIIESVCGIHVNRFNHNNSNLIPPLSSYLPSYKYKDICHFDWMVCHGHFKLLSEKLARKEIVIFTRDSPSIVLRHYNRDDLDYFFKLYRISLPKKRYHGLRLSTLVNSTATSKHIYNERLLDFFYVEQQYILQPDDIIYCYQNMNWQLLKLIWKYQQLRNKDLLHILNDAMSRGLETISMLFQTVPSVFMLLSTNPSKIDISYCDIIEGDRGGMDLPYNNNVNKFLNGDLLFQMLSFNDLNLIKSIKEYCGLFIHINSLQTYINTGVYRNDILELSFAYYKDQINTIPPSTNLNINDLITNYGLHNSNLSPFTMKNIDTNSSSYGMGNMGGMSSSNSSYRMGNSNSSYRMGNMGNNSSSYGMGNMGGMSSSNSSYGMGNMGNNSNSYGMGSMNNSCGMDNMGGMGSSNSSYGMGNMGGMGSSSSSYGMGSINISFGIGNMGNNNSAYGNLGNMNNSRNSSVKNNPFANSSRMLSTHVPSSTLNQIPTNTPENQIYKFNLELKESVNEIQQIMDTNYQLVMSNELPFIPHSNHQLPIIRFLFDTQRQLTQPHITLIVSAYNGLLDIFTFIINHHRFSEYLSDNGLSHQFLLEELFLFSVTNRNYDIIHYLVTKQPLIDRVHYDMILLKCVHCLSGNNISIKLLRILDPILNVEHTSQLLKLAITHGNSDLVRYIMLNYLCIFNEPIDRLSFFNPSTIIQFLDNYQFLLQVHSARKILNKSIQILILEHQKELVDVFIHEKYRFHLYNMVKDETSQFIQGVKEKAITEKLIRMYPSLSDELNSFVNLDTNYLN